MGCLLSRKACAEYLGVCVRTVRHWDDGRNRVPWSAVRLLRLLRCGDLGGLRDEWDGWTINRLGLHSPEGRTYRQADMRTWWLQLEHARLWREAYDRGEIRGCGGNAPARPQAVPLQPGVRVAARQAAAAPVHPIEAASTLTAFACPPPGSGFAARRRADKAVSLSGLAGNVRRAAAARSDAGLVSSSKQVERTLSQTRFQRRFSEVRRAL
jgi:hypothetical protein